MLLAVLACHSNGIVHRDVKPDNFMIKDVNKQGKDMRILLIDMGLSQHFALSSHEETQKEAAVPYRDHCYFYNLELRGRQPACRFKANECHRKHERIPNDIFESMPPPSREVD